MLTRRAYVAFLVSIFLSNLATCIYCKMVPLEVTSPSVTREAEFALEELQKMSDSGAYSSLQLRRVISAAEEDGIYHINTKLEMELSSPFFHSGKDSELFSVIVMRHMEDGLRSFAINEFPSMSDAAIEQFHTRKIETKRLERELAYRRLELDASNAPAGNSISSIREILRYASDPAIVELRRQLSDSFQPRIEGHPHLIREENELNELALEQLLDVSLGFHEATDFKRFRAKQILDSVMLQLQKSNS